MKHKLQLEMAEFYITNVCNLNCEGCNSFNNYNFKGTSLWKDWQSTYQTWAEQLDIKHINLLGGEPMANPSYLEWLYGLKELWPESSISLITNGTLLKKDNKSLYDFFAMHNDCRLRIGLHNINRQDQVKTLVINWLKNDIEIKKIVPALDTSALDMFINNYKKFKDTTWQDCYCFEDFYNLPNHIQEECKNNGIDPSDYADPKKLQESDTMWLYKDNNGVTVEIDVYNYFVQSAIKYNKQTKKYCLHDSNKEQAHRKCMSKECHTFNNGKLYKCRQASLFSQFDQQLGLDLSDNDRDLMNSYEPLTTNCSQATKVKFIENLPNSIDMCKFCPENYKIKQIQAQRKGYSKE